MKKSNWMILGTIVALILAVQIVLVIVRIQMQTVTPALESVNPAAPGKVP